MRRDAPVYVLRHGETEWNREGRIQGACDSALTERGRAQAAAMGRALAAELALESGKPSGEHVLNVLARLKAGSQAEVAAARTPLTLTVAPQANVQRYDRLRSVGDDDPQGVRA